MLAFFAFIVAMFVSIVLIPPLMRSAARFAFIDLPAARKVHDAPIPRIGGLAMVAGAIIPILLWVAPEREIRGFLYGVSILVIFGLWDDRRALDYRLKFLGQFLAVAVVVFYGGVIVRFVPFAGIDPIPLPLSWALTVFALLGVTNAINLADGLDGLAAGTTLLSIGLIALLAYLAGDPVLLTLAMAVMGAIVGFLRFNTYPAQVFMGDTGSQFLGYSAGVLIIILTQQSSPVLSPAMPLLLLGLPLLDTFLVIGQRVAEGRSPFHADRNHVHHKLLELGLDHYESVVVIYALQAALVTLAFVCRFRSDLLNIAIFAGTLAVLALAFARARKRGWVIRHKPHDTTPSAVTTLARRLRANAALSRGPMLFAAVSLPLYGLYAVWRVPYIPADGRMTAFVLGGSAATALVCWWRRPTLGVLERLITYVAITAVIFYWCSARPPQTIAALAENIYFLTLGISLLVAYRFSTQRSFAVTPTDFLIILIAILLPGFARTLLPQPYVAEVGIKTLVAFYAVELVLSTTGTRARWLRVALVLVLGALCARLMFGDLSAGVGP